MCVDTRGQIEQRAKSTDKMPCPPDSRELGRSTWTYLHSLAAHYPDKPGADEKKEMSSFVRTFARTYPCHYCADHMQEYIQDKVRGVGRGRYLGCNLCILPKRVDDVGWGWICSCYNHLENG